MYWWGGSCKVVVIRGAPKGLSPWEIHRPEMKLNTFSDPTLPLIISVMLYNYHFPILNTFML